MVQRDVITRLGRAAGAATTPVVCLHGFTGSTDSWRDHISALAGSGPVFGVALPGHAGGADVLDGFGANIDALAGSIDTAGLTKCHLIGYSLGARTALGLAVRHPRIAARLTLIGVHPGLATEAERDARRHADARWTAMLRADGLEPFVDAWERLPIFATQCRVDPARLERQRRTRLSHDPEQLARSLDHMGLAQMPDYGPHLGDIAVPTRLVTGSLDTKFTALAREMVRAIPGAEHVAVDRCGHNVLIEAAAEAWA